MWKLKLSCWEKTHKRTKLELKFKKCFCWNLVNCCVFVYKIWFKTKFGKKSLRFRKQRKKIFFSKNQMFCIHMICELSFISNKRTNTRHMYIRIKNGPLFLPAIYWFMLYISHRNSSFLQEWKHCDSRDCRLSDWIHVCMMWCGAVLCVCMEEARESVCVRKNICLSVFRRFFLVAYNICFRVWRTDGKVSCVFSLYLTSSSSSSLLLFFGVCCLAHYLQNGAKPTAM